MRMTLDRSNLSATIALIACLLALWPCEEALARSYKVTVGYEGSEIPLVVSPGQNGMATPTGQVSPNAPVVEAGFPAPVSRPMGTLVPSPHSPRAMQPVNPSIIGDQAFEPQVGPPPSADFTQTLIATGRATAHGIQFNKDSPALRPDATPALQQILTMLQQNPDLQILIEGHTDNQGTNNQILSRLRAYAVRSWLIDHGVSSTRLRAIGLGDSRPIDTNNTVEGRARNRRVDLVVE